MYLVALSGFSHPGGFSTILLAHAKSNNNMGDLKFALQYSPFLEQLLQYSIALFGTMT
jgi:hypothetical protein